MHDLPSRTPSIPVRHQHNARASRHNVLCHWERRPRRVDSCAPFQKVCYDPRRIQEDPGSPAELDCEPIQGCKQGTPKDLKALENLTFRHTFRPVLLPMVLVVRGAPGEHCRIWEHRGLEEAVYISRTFLRRVATRTR